MDKTDFDDLAGRINGIGQALLRLTAELEWQGVIDGPRVSATWRRGADNCSNDHPAHHSTQVVLRQLAQQLDESRAARPARSTLG